MTERELPSGTLTFLFTDIEGHTPLWESHPTEMSAALAHHDRVLADAVASNDGFVLKSDGDAIMAVFSEATRAVAAAGTAQAELGRIQVAGRRLRVRMGLHTGTAELRNGDYFGPDVIRAARLRDVAHGGQILASRATTALASGEEWNALGSYPLRGLSAPELISQLGNASFPPLRTAATRSTLPTPRTSFIGRRAEVADLAGRLSQERLVTLTGVGGSGKTRLAIQAGAASLDHFPGGVFFADLSATTDDEGLPQAIIAGLEIQAAGGGGGPAIQQITGHLSAHRPLLILDNCEHLLDACADIADVLLEACPHLTILATSREVLHVDGEHVVQVRSLDLDTDAADLFAARAAAAGVTDLDADLVQTICRRLDGIPLAIELAAARTAHLGLDQIASHLDDRFNLLTGGRRRVQRQQTLEATLDWSYSLLAEKAREGLRRLAVFAGTFSLDAAAGICGVPTDMLMRLVDASLVQLEAAAGRYRLLETVRLYAEVKLRDAGEVEDYRDRHLRWYVDTFEAADTLRTRPVLDDFAWFAHDPFSGAEVDNVRAALRWGGVRGLWDDAARLLGATRNMWQTSAPGEAVAWATTMLGEGVSGESRVMCLLTYVLNMTATAGDIGDTLDVQVERITEAVELTRGRSDGVELECALFAANFWAVMAMVRPEHSPLVEELLEQASQVAKSLESDGATAQLLAVKIQIAINREDLEQVVELGRELNRVTGGYGNGHPSRFGPSALWVVAAVILGDMDTARHSLPPPQEHVPSSQWFLAGARALVMAVDGRHQHAAAELLAAIRSLRSPGSLSGAHLLAVAAVMAYESEDLLLSCRWFGALNTVFQRMIAMTQLLLMRSYVRRLREQLSREEREAARMEGAALGVDGALAEVEPWLQLLADRGARDS